MAKSQDCPREASLGCPPEVTFASSCRGVDPEQRAGLARLGPPWNDLPPPPPPPMAGLEDSGRGAEGASRAKGHSHPDQLDMPGRALQLPCLTPAPPALALPHMQWLQACPHLLRCPRAAPGTWPPPSAASEVSGHERSSVPTGLARCRGRVLRTWPRDDPPTLPVGSRGSRYTCPEPIAAPGSPGRQLPCGAGCPVTSHVGSGGMGRPWARVSTGTLWDLAGSEPDSAMPKVCT